MPNYSLHANSVAIFIYSLKIDDFDDFIATREKVTLSRIAKAKFLYVTQE